jgi:tetratricopeptide (TPR) repeat protein
MEMQKKYSNWIEKYRKMNKISNKCRDVTEKMVAEFPELTRKRGIIHLLNTEENETRPHWWCVDPDGEIIDPTASQYPFVLEYEEWDENHGEPTGKCLCCGNFVSDFNTFCNDACETEYRIYQEEEMQKEESIQSTGKCLNCGDPVYGSDNFCNDSCEIKLLTNLEYEEALECCNEIIKINPQDDDAWNNKGDALNK